MAALADDVLAPIVHTEWDRNFVSKPEFRGWLMGQLAIAPITDGTTLLTYVHDRLHLQASLNNMQVQPSGAAAQNTMQARPVQSPLEITQQQSAISYNQSNSYSTSIVPAQTMNSYYQEPMNTAYTESPNQGFINPSALMSPPPPAATPAIFNGNAVAAIPGQALSSSKPVVRKVSGDKSATSSSAAASSKAQPHASTSKVPAISWTKLLVQLRAHLDPKNIAVFPLRSAKAISDAIDLFGPNTDSDITISASHRKDLLKTLLDGGTPDFYKALVEEKKFRVNMETWLVEASHAAVLNAKSEGEPTDRIWSATLTPLLKLWDILPITLDHLKGAEIGIKIRNLAKEFSKDSGIHDRDIYRLALSINRKWKLLTEQADLKVDNKRKPEGLSVDAGPAITNKKRKVSPTPAVQSKSSAPPATSQPGAGMTNMKGLAGLSFGKRPTNPPSAGGSGAFLEAMNSLKGKSAVTANSSEDVIIPDVKRQPTSSMNSSMARGKKKIPKTVRWVKDEDLVQTKLIERAIYEDEYELSGESLSVMEGKEGQVLHAAMKQPENEDRSPWYDPYNVDIPELSAEDVALRAYPPSQPKFDFGLNDAQVQTQREATVPEFIPENQYDYPDTPSEPALEEIDVNVAVQLELGDRLMNDPEFQIALRAAHTPKNLASQPNISALLAQLAGGALDPMAAANPLSSLLTTINSSNANLLNPSPAPYPNSQPMYPYASPNTYGVPPPQNMWTPPVQPQQQAKPVHSGPRPARGGRNKRKQNICRFFAKGECVSGDQCQYSHG